MKNKQKPIPLRYSTISPSLSPDKRAKFKSLIQVKEKPNTFNASLTKYKSIRELRRKQEQQHTKTQRNTFQYQRNKPHNNNSFEDMMKNTDIIEIIKLKLHDHDSNERVKTDYSMNRAELKHCIKKKKTMEFINNHSLDLIRTMFPKKIDLIINQLKLRRTQEETQPHSEVVIDLKQRPKTANNVNNKPSSFLVRVKEKSRAVESPVKRSMEMTKVTTCQDDVKDVSAWEFDPLEEELLYVEQPTKRSKSKPKNKK